MVDLSYGVDSVPARRRIESVNTKPGYRGSVADISDSDRNSDLSPRNDRNLTRQYEIHIVTASSTTPGSPRTMWMDPRPDEAPDTALRTRPLSGSLALALGISVLFVIVAGVLPFQLAGIFAEAAKVITVGI